MIKETIVVEGKSDFVAVKKAVEANIIITSGMGIRAETLELIRLAQERCGVIILTDPDSPGETIRRIIAKRVKGVKHAFIPVDEARLHGNVGVENASPESIRLALSMTRTEVEVPVEIYNTVDMMLLGLTGKVDSAKRRAIIGKKLGIGYCSAKQFLSRLNSYGIEVEELKAAYEGAKNEEK